MTFPNDLQPGDILLYSEKDIIDDLIKWKTSGTATHIEIYAGVGRSWASRSGLGTGDSTYPLRLDGLCMVRRPIRKFDAQAASDYYTGTLKGLPYGFSDILADVGITESSKGIDCSHLAALLLENAGCPQFDSTFPKDIISPRDFQIVRESLIIFKA